MVARLGSGASSYVIILSDMTDQTVPNIIFSVFSLVAGACVMFLPETRDQPLPDTLNDAVTFLRVDRSHLQCMPSGRGGGPRAASTCESNATAGSPRSASPRTRNDTYNTHRVEDCDVTSDSRRRTAR